MSVETRASRHQPPLADQRRHAGCSGERHGDDAAATGTSEPARSCATGVARRPARTARGSRTVARIASAAVLRIVLPKGSLERATLDSSRPPTCVVRSSAVDYRATIDDPRVAEVRILRPQEIPVYVAEGLFDLGITGRDWVEETASDVVSLGELRYSKATSNPVRGGRRRRRRLAGAARRATCPQGVRVSSEYPELTRRFFAERGIDADVRLSYGASEAKIPDIADCVVDITETGRALRAAGLRIIDTILTSYTEVVANPARTTTTPSATPWAS